VVAAAAEGDTERMLEHAEVCFDGVERLRARQGDERDRSRELSESSVMHYFVAGLLLRDPSPARLEQAFQVVERLRARNLLDWLYQAKALPLDPDDPSERQWQQAVDEIAALQRTLLEPSLDDADRQLALVRLDVLEAHEARLRTTLVAEPLGLVEPSTPFARLDEVQRALGPHEALLSYQLADELDRFGAPEGGAWLWVITRAEVRAIPLPERRTLEPRLSFVAGLLARRDGREQAALAGLHRDLLAPALAELPPEVTHLLVVPDGELWSLPLAALPAAPGAAPLVARYSLSLLPSVTSWLRWGQLPPATPPGLLALARPEGVLGGTVAPWRAGTLATGLQLGALPMAGEEVAAITRVWGHEHSQAEVGDGASERFLKRADLSRYGLLHFATHAVMDPQHPERSAVVLAAGDEAEDGLLQTREIVRLALHDKVVVLSACSGAAGQLVRGEGVMSLAHAFLRGGARAVVASRWPLADADAVVLFERLYVHIDDGLPLADALARAQRDLHAAGAPAAAWAGVVVLGRGDVVLVPRPAWWPHRRWLAALGALVALGLAARLALRGRARIVLREHERIRDPRSSGPRRQDDWPGPRASRLTRLAPGRAAKRPSAAAGVRYTKGRQK
jgi:CHAT domain-containing protein